jgi:hypothetical protein
MSFCSKCGSELDPSWIICPHCGKGDTIEVIIKKEGRARRNVIWGSGAPIVIGSIFLYYYFTHTNTFGDHTYNIENLISGTIFIAIGLLISITYILYKHRTKSKT